MSLPESSSRPLSFTVSWVHVTVAVLPVVVLFSALSFYAGTFFGASTLPPLLDIDSSNPSGDNIPSLLLQDGSNLTAPPESTTLSESTTLKATLEGISGATLFGEDIPSQALEDDSTTKPPEDPLLKSTLPLRSAAVPTQRSAEDSRFLIEAYHFLGPIPWENLTESVRQDLSLGGSITVHPNFLADPAVSSPPVWASAVIEGQVKNAETWTLDSPGDISAYGRYSSDAFYQAMQKYPVKGKTVLVIGSQSPWVEAICLAYGATSVTTVDFNVPVVDYPRLKAISLAELDASTEGFDAVFSYSSLEHDGLGRYGDPVNPNGDIERVKKIRGLVAEDGLFYLGFPLGNDSLVYNAHRVYGPIRFPMIIEGWNLLDTFGGVLDELLKSTTNDWTIQPLHVLSLKPSSAADLPQGGSRFLLKPYPFLGPIPWENLTGSVQQDFTMNGSLAVRPKFTADPAVTSPPVWSSEGIDKDVRFAKTWTPKSAGTISSYGRYSSTVFYESLQKYPVKDKTVLVIGSQSPWVECICLAYGAKSVTTVDFNVPVVEHPKIKAISLAELDATTERFEAVFSYSSLEHDGLGRYGDPINPYGDIERVKKIRGLVTDNGLFYLGFPLGNDSLVFNTHRFYGPIRFPMIIEGWNLLDTFGGVLEEMLHSTAAQWSLQPLHVLSLKPSG